MADLEGFSFGDSPALADELIALVLAGKKTATCWAASEGDKGVAVGKRWMAEDGAGWGRARPRDGRTDAAPVRRGRRVLRLGRGRGRPLA